ncbi:phosphoenolpyruvate synthase [Candidatus Pacearchaeota archaeon]|nr:phosphoenolpyruvate synthase [Candidatus Pacearchaeota archaeon]
MQEKNEVDFVKWFSELNKDSGQIAGGKGANLAEIYNMKISVPAGFVVTAQAYDYFIEKAGVKDRITKLLSQINYEDIKQLDETTKKIREIILDAKFPVEMEEEILESYENLDTRDLENAKSSALGILKNSAEPVFVAVRSSATAEDLADASFAGQQDTFLNIKGKRELLEHIKKCFASLYTSRATYYRNKKGFEHSKVSIAVIVQQMVDADKSGVIFSKDPSYKNENTIIEAVFGLGEGIVSGKVTPDRYIVSDEFEIIDSNVADKKIAFTRNSRGEKEIVKLKEDISKRKVLKDYEIKKLTEYALKLEEHYQKPQDIEFAIEGEEIYIVQTRPITTMTTRVEEGVTRELRGEVILTGLAASPGIAAGKIKIVEELSDLQKIEKGAILVTKMTNPDMVVAMQRSVAIVTDEGGLTAHAAIVSREMGIPCVVGTQEATTRLKEGEMITVDGYTGKIYKGKIAETQQKEVLPVRAQTRTEIKVIVDLPSFAERAAKTGLKNVGLTRIEGIIAESGKHPEYFLKQKKIDEYEQVIFKGIEEIAKYFEAIWVRTSDIRSDEFQNLKGAPKDKEANPMLGLHGIRYGIKNPEILKAEIRALKKVAEMGKKVGLLLPQVISVEEIQKVKEFLKEADFDDSRVGVMVETPAAVQLIKNFCEEGIDFISFGTNDLTQYILAVDRGNQEVQHLYNELNPAVLYQLGFVIRTCKKYKVETSICGQAGSKKEMAKFLVDNGIDSISVNADMAREIADYVKELEETKIKGTDKEPEEYQSEKEVKEDFVKPQIVEEEEKITSDDSEVFSKIEGIGKLERSDKEIDKEIETIEEEKKEYLEKHSKEVGDTQEFTETDIEENNEDTSADLGDVTSESEPDEDKPEFSENDFPEEHEEARKKEGDEVLDIF